ncbi:hypothetical protein [Klebsiella pneumoniae IS39]|nr:hypothetical protein [Klebsiella pneumoniae IS39]
MQGCFFVVAILQVVFATRAGKTPRSAWHSADANNASR